MKASKIGKGKGGLMIERAIMKSRRSLVTALGWFRRGELMGEMIKGGEGGGMEIQVKRYLRVPR